ncbi:MAG: DNA primase [Rubrobacteraceae bacterium]
MKISQRSIEEVRETTSIVEIASEFTALKRQGTRYTGLCPYPEHSEKTPSFSVSPEKGFYYCFGCGKGGDAIKLLTDLRDLPFVEAVTYLAERSGTKLNYEGGSRADSRAARERHQRRRAIHKALAAAVAYYHKYMVQSTSNLAETARQYLANRGIENSSIVEFRLGVAPERGGAGFEAAARKLGLGREVLEAAGLLSPRGGERFAGRITFPISDRRGRIVGFGARALGDVQPKYLNTPETEVFNKRDLLYGFPQVMEPIRRERAAMVVEGYTDVLMLYQAGIKNAVATLGTAMTSSHLRTLSSYADKVYVLFDPDDAGEKAIERAATTAAELKQDLRVVRLDEDPADWLLHHSSDEFRELLSGAVPILEHVIRRTVGRARGADATERSRAVPELQRLVAQINDPVFHNEAVRLSAEAVGVGPEVFRRGPQDPSAAPPEDGEAATTDPHSQAGEELLALILARPEIGAKLFREGLQSAVLPEPVGLSAQDFGTEGQARLFALLSKHPGRDFDSIVSDERARPLLDEVGRLQAVGERLYPTPAAARAAWLRVKILSRERNKNQTQDYDEKSRLQGEIQVLREALRATADQS